MATKGVLQNEPVLVAEDGYPSKYVNFNKCPSIGCNTTRLCLRLPLFVLSSNICLITPIMHRMRDANSGVGGPITVFTETSCPPTSELRIRDQQQRFLYAGAHTITRIQYLMPRTPLLIKMLESKFTGPKSGRSEEAWHKSLNLRWAIVDLTKMDGEEEQWSNPMEPLKEIKKKSVSEMLEESRLREGSVGKENGKPRLEDNREAAKGDEES